MADRQLSELCLEMFMAQTYNTTDKATHFEAAMLPILRKHLNKQSTRLAQLENTAANYKALFDELCGYVAFMCEHFGDKRNEVPCDAWRLRDHVMRAKKRLAQLEAFRAEVEGLEAKWRSTGDIVWTGAADRLRAALKRAGRVGGEHPVCAHEWSAAEPWTSARCLKCGEPVTSRTPNPEPSEDNPDE